MYIFHTLASQRWHDSRSIAIYFLYKVYEVHFLGRARIVKEHSEFSFSRQQRLSPWSPRYISVVRHWTYIIAFGPWLRLKQNLFYKSSQVWVIHVQGLVILWGFSCPTMIFNFAYDIQKQLRTNIIVLSISSLNIGWLNFRIQGV